MKRLDEELPEGFEASLVRAGQGGAPSEERRNRALAAGLGVLAAGASAGLAPLAAKAGASASLNPAAATALLGLGWKGVALSVIVAMAVGGATTLAFRRGAVVPPVPTTVAPSPAPGRSVDEPARTPGAASPALATPATDERPPPPSPPSPAPSLPPSLTTVAHGGPGAAPAPPPAPARADLTSELAALDDARAALDASRPADALRALDAYDRRFPRGSLAREAALLRVQGLVLLGDRAEATRRARPLASDPLYRARLRAILGEDVSP